MDAVFKALADATRRELLDRLRADNSQTLNELCARLAKSGASMTRQAVSKHFSNGWPLVLSILKSYRELNCVLRAPWCEKQEVAASYRD